jgi:hypothetical protein
MSLHARPTRSHWTRPSLLFLLAATMIWAPAEPVPATQAPAAEPATAPAWKAVAASGKVEARPHASEQIAWRAVVRGDALQPATLVRTGRRGRVTLTRNASLLILDPHSQVELPANARPGIETSVVQRSGSVLYEVDSRENPHFEVVTPYLVAGVKGTEFLVTVNDDYTSVTVERGLVEVTNSDTGEIRRVGAGESLIREHDRLEMDLIDGGERRARADVKKESRRLARMTENKPGAQLSDDPGARAGAKDASRQDDPETIWTSAGDWLGSGSGRGAHAGVLDAGNSLDAGSSDLPSVGADLEDRGDDAYYDDDKLDRYDDGSDDSNDDGGGGGGSGPGPGTPGDPDTIDTSTDPGGVVIPNLMNSTQNANSASSAPSAAGSTNDQGQPGGAKVSTASPALLLLLEEQQVQLEAVDQEGERIESNREQRRGTVRRSE